MAQGGALRAVFWDYEELGAADEDGAVDIDGDSDDGAVDIEGASDDGAATLGAVLSSGSVGELPVLLGVQAATALAAAITSRIMSLFMQVSHWDAHRALGMARCAGFDRPNLPAGSGHPRITHGGFPCRGLSWRGASLSGQSASSAR